MDQVQFNEIKQKIEEAANQKFAELIENQKGHVEVEFLELLKGSKYFKDFYAQAFIEGVGYMQRKMK